MPIQILKLLKLKMYSPRDPIELFTSLWDYSKLGDVYGMPLERYALADKSGRLADRKRVKLRGLT